MLLVGLLGGFLIDRGKVGIAHRRLLRDGAEHVAQLLVAAFFRLLLIPARLLGDGFAGAGEVKRRTLLIMLVVDVREVFASGCPTVVKQNRLAFVKPRRDLVNPAGAELGLDGLHGAAGVFVSVAGGLGSVDPQLPEHEACGGGEHAILAGHCVGEGVEGCGIHHCPAAARACGQRCDRHTMVGGHLLHG